MGTKKLREYNKACQKLTERNTVRHKGEKCRHRDDCWPYCKGCARDPDVNANHTSQR